MSRVKQIPDDVRKVCIQIVCGYQRRRQAYMLRRSELMANTPDNIVTIRDKEDPTNENLHEGVYIPGSHTASRTTENIAERIMGLEDHPETKRMRAVEYAAKRVGLDLPENQREVLKKAIIISCIQGRKYPFERLMVEGMERSCFYDRRMKFLVDIAKYMEMI